jgi:dethiobiotin synthetase
VNPFYFKQPLAPHLAAAASTRETIRLTKVVQHIKKIASRCDFLLVEGAGGVLVPLGKKWFVRELIGALNCRVIVVSRNQLGTINHTLLTEKALQDQRTKALKVVLMEQKTPDLSAKRNVAYLQQILAPKAVMGLDFLGQKARQPKVIRANAKRLKKVLAALVA